MRFFIRVFSCFGHSSLFSVYCCFWSFSVSNLALFETVNHWSTVQSSRPCGRSTRRMGIWHVHFYYCLGLRPSYAFMGPINVIGRYFCIPVVSLYTCYKFEDFCISIEKLSKGRILPPSLDMSSLHCSGAVTKGSLVVLQSSDITLCWISWGFLCQ